MVSLNGLAFIPARHCADSLLLSSPTEGGLDRKLRKADRRQRLVLFPASAKGLVQDHEFVGCGLLGSCILVLQGVFRALGRRERLLAGEDGLVQLRRRSP